MPYDAQACWDEKSDYFGASPLALTRVANSHNYSLVYTDTHGVNAFFVRNDCLLDSSVYFNNQNDVEALYGQAVFLFFGVYQGDRGYSGYSPTCF